MQWLSELIREEGLRHIDELEEALLELKERSVTAEGVSQVCRALDDLRSVGILGDFDAVATFADELAAPFHVVRSGRLKVSRQLIYLALAGLDQLRNMIEATVEDPEVAGAAADIAASLRRLAASPPHPLTAPPAAGRHVRPGPCLLPLGQRPGRVGA